MIVIEARRGRPDEGVWPRSRKVAFPADAAKAAAGVVLARHP